MLYQRSHTEIEGNPPHCSCSEPLFAHDGTQRHHLEFQSNPTALSVDTVSESNIAGTRSYKKMGGITSSITLLPTCVDTTIVVRG